MYVYDIKYGALFPRTDAAPRCKRRVLPLPASNAATHQPEVRMALEPKSFTIASLWRFAVSVSLLLFRVAPQPAAFKGLSTDGAAAATMFELARTIAVPPCPEPGWHPAPSADCLVNDDSGSSHDSHRFGHGCALPTGSGEACIYCVIISF